MACTLVVAVAAGSLVACGEDDFENKPRPPVPLQLTGVITEKRVTISPDEVGAGPVVITISNQTNASHTATLEGEGVTERTATINPLDTATLQKTLEPGEYEVLVDSEKGLERIRPATLVIGPERESGSDELLLP